MSEINLSRYLEERRRRVDAFLISHFEGRGERFAKLYEAVRYSLLAPGKRIRPVLALASYEVFQKTGAGYEVAVRAGGAIEMIHAYSLIHDDLPAMDNDDLRRGRPTNHRVYGEAMAILAGDALLTEAFSVISGSVGVPAAVLLEIVGDIAAAAGGMGMAGGQALDLQSQGRQIGPEELECLHRHKTGSLIGVSVTSGAKLAGATGASLEAVRGYGGEIGLAFQIADDILDVEGGAGEMGKATGGDARKEKATYPSILGMEKSKRLAGELVEKAIGALKVFGDEADPLRGIARYIVARRS